MNKFSTCEKTLLSMKCIYDTRSRRASMILMIISYLIICAYFGREFFQHCFTFILINVWIFDSDIFSLWRCFLQYLWVIEKFPIFPYFFSVILDVCSPEFRGLPVLYLLVREIFILHSNWGNY